MTTCFLSGVQPMRTELEIAISPGLPSVEIVGLADPSIREAKNRVRNAIRNSGFVFPNSRVTVSLLPAYVHKSGSSVDLPLALGILAASGQLPMGKKSLFAYGELSLDGRVLGVPGGILRILQGEGFSHIIGPVSHMSEIQLIRLPVFCAETLRDAVEFLICGKRAEAERGAFTHANQPDFESQDGESTPDYSSLKGQERARRGILIAAAGYHSILFSGSPGCGKTTSAEILHGLLPPLSDTERVEVLARKSLTSPLCQRDIQTRLRPFRRLDPSCSSVSIMGGGKPFSPGALALSRHGVLFLDELPEFSRNVLECIRLALDGKRILASGDEGGDDSFGGFLLVGAMNPCRCGNLLESDNSCACTDIQRSQYRNRISGALYDRFDMAVDMFRTDPNALRGRQPSSRRESASLRARVFECWQLQYARNRNCGLPLLRNGEITDGIEFAEIFRISDKVLAYASDISCKMSLSVRGYFFLLRVARTIGDLEDSSDLREEHLLEATCFRRKNSRHGG